MRKNKLLRQVGEEQLLRDLKDLKTATKIAKKYEVSVITAYSAFEIMGVDCYKNADVSGTITKEVLELAYKEIGTIKGVGRKLGISYQSVKEYMDKFELEYKHQIIYNVNHNFFSKETEEVFYIAGFIAADGCVKRHKNSHILSIGLSIKDKDHLIKIKNILQSEAPIKDFIIRNSKRNLNWNDTWKSEIQITSKQIFDDLAKFNIVPKKSLVYNFPDWIINHPLKHHFMRGYNDGDGCFHRPKLPEGKITEQLYFALLGTPKFLETYRNILEEECNLEKRIKPIRMKNNIGTLEYGGNGILKKITDYLYKDATIYLERKYNIVYG